MDSNQIYALLQSIAATTKKKEKENLLLANNCDELKHVLVAAYDPIVSYGLLNLMEINRSGTQAFDRNTWDLLSRLKQRELTGQAAKQSVSEHLSLLHPDSIELFRYILNKDLRAGISTGIINGVFDNIISEVPYMRCKLLSKVKDKIAKWNWVKGIFSQLKADGMFINAIIRDSSVTLLTRSGQSFPIEKCVDIYAALIDERRFEDKWLHGELLVYRDNKLLPRQEGNGLLNSVMQGFELPNDCKIVLNLWDAVPISEVVRKGVGTQPYSERYAFLQEALSKTTSDRIVLIETKIVYSLHEAFEHYESMLLRKLEGTVVKNPDGLWEDTDTGSDDVIKLKLHVEVDLRVIGYNPGSGKNKNLFGSLITESEDSLLITDVAGFKDSARKHIFEQMTNDVDFIGTRIITVKSSCLCVPSKKKSTYSLFLPGFVEEILDKTKADTLEKIMAEFESAKKAR